jgi:hypothetical protein
MTGVVDEELTDKLRAEAEGVYPSEAAVELVVRARLLPKLLGFVEVDPDGLYAWIDWAAVSAALSDGQLGLSGGERRLIGVAASLGAGAPVSLGDLPGLDERYSLLVLQAIAHSFGWHEQHCTALVDGSFTSARPLFATESPVA